MQDFEKLFLLFLKKKNHGILPESLYDILKTSMKQFRKELMEDFFSIGYTFRCNQCFDLLWTIMEDLFIMFI